MKRMSMQLGLVAIALMLGLFPSSALGNPRKDTTEKSNTKKVEQSTQDQIAEKRKKIMQEASSAISETHNALKALAGKSGFGFFEKIKSSISQLFNSSQPAAPTHS